MDISISILPIWKSVSHPNYVLKISHLLDSIPKEGKPPLRGRCFFRYINKLTLRNPLYLFIRPLMALLLLGSYPNLTSLVTLSLTINHSFIDIAIKHSLKQALYNRVRWKETGFGFSLKQNIYFFLRKSRCCV